MIGNQLKNFLILIAALLLVNFVASNFFERFDLTENKRYTLSATSRETLEEVDDPLFITIYLQGDFPSEFKRLQTEIRFLLEEFSALNPEVKFEFVNPVGENKNAQKVGQQFYEAGMPPENLNTYQNGKVSEQLIFPWAVAEFGKKRVKIPLLQKKMGQETESTINNSVAQLEYAFTDAFHKLVQQRSKKIAVMRGNGELPNRNITSFIQAGRAYYNFAPFTLDSVVKSPAKTLRELQEFDLVVEAKPTENFTEKEKLVLDQYVMNGGKMLWLMDGTSAEKDSLFTNTANKMIVLPQMLRLTDFFFKYGVRINPSLVKDFRSAPLILSRGRGQNRQVKPQPWFYMPLAQPKSDHPIVKDIESVRFDFASPIDTLENGIHKKVLLASSPKSKVMGTPRQINLSDIREKPDLKTFNQNRQNLAILLEGQFESVFANRVKPFPLQKPLKKSRSTQMIVVSDGDVIKNEVKRDGPVPLGKDRYNGKIYGNENFLINSLNYLLGDKKLLSLRSKEVKLAFLNTEKVGKKSTSWKIINLGAPLAALLLFGLLFNFIRKRKYA